jgi:L-iditol 2-dehydrogenase
MMLAATFTQGGSFVVREIPHPAINDGDLLLRVTAAAICGTDIKIVKNGHRKLKSGQTIILGHEFVGVIEEAGPRVTGFKQGQRVGVAPNAGCGHCPPCKRGQSNYCSDYTAFGIDRDGAHAPFVRIPEVFLQQGNVMALPECVTDAAAALLEPLSCVVAGQRAVQVAQGDTVLIFGAGPMGLLHVMVARESGAAAVLMFDPMASRLTLAGEMGAQRTASTLEELDRVISEIAPGGVDVAITAAPVAEALSVALDRLAPFGRLCAFAGLPAGAPRVALDVNRIHYKNLTLTGTTGGSVGDYQKALQIIRSGRVDVCPVISHTFPMAGIEDAYKTALSGQGMKIVIRGE